MPCCSAFKCSYNHVNIKKSGKTVHRFPFSRPDVLQQWIKNMHRKDWGPSYGSVLCSDHFTPDCFVRTLKYVKLRKDAVPTIFNFPEYLQKNFLKPAEEETLASQGFLQLVEPLEDISNNKNQILVAPEGMDVQATFNNNNGYSIDDKNIVIIKDEKDCKAILNCGNEGDDSDANRTIIVSDGTNIKTEWCGNDDEYIYPPSTYDPDYGEESCKADNLDTSKIRALITFDPDFYVRKLKRMDKKQKKVRKHIKILQQKRRRQIRKIAELLKEVHRLKKNVAPPKCTTHPIFHVIPRVNS